MTARYASRLGWYARRLAKMSPAEMAWRAHDRALQVAWSRRQVTRGQLEGGVGLRPGERRFVAVLPAGTAAQVPEQARKAILAAANQLMRGEWEVLGVDRTDMVRPDWFYDPLTRRRAPDSDYAFRINHRSEALTGNVKQVWEISRLQHLTLLATAWFVSHDDAYASQVIEQLQSWWRENPFLSGVHWTSGIEIGIRLISMTWIRRLLDDWPEVTKHFEGNELAIRQIAWHQEYLAAFHSRGSSANNHVIAEAAGQLVASCAFPWFPNSSRWRRQATRLLEHELIRNTFASGIDRELASDYQSFVAELGLLAAIEADRAGCPLSAAVWRRLCAMVDSGAALLDERLRPPRQGDGDEGRALLLDAPAANRWPSLLALGAAIFGPCDWWPKCSPDAASCVVGAMIGSVRDFADRPAERPWHFPDAGITVLRTTNDREPEIWCRCDGGPHGFLSIAAHAHADALSIEVRHRGVDILADPGTYCYHGEPAWRSYFRSTIAHNTIELDGRNQSNDGGPFLWIRHANGREINIQDIGDAAEWTAEHDGYLGLRQPARHRRCVRLDRASRTIDVVDEISGDRHSLRLAFHLGPEVEVDLDGAVALLHWQGEYGPGIARLELPQALRWSMHRGQTDPILGWYSSGLGRRTPAIALIGRGLTSPEQPLTTRMQFLDTRTTAHHSFTASAVSWTAIDDRPRDTPGVRAETR